MRTKLIVTALLTALSIPVSAEVFKCQVDGKTVYQQSPCAIDNQGNESGKMKVNTRDTGAGGIRESELEVSKSLNETINSAATSREETRQAESAAEIKHRDMMIERRKAAAAESAAAAAWARARGR